MLAYVIIGVLCLVIIMLLIKIHFLRKSAEEIGEAFAEKLNNDTNTLIALSHRDKYMQRLTAQINIQLKKLRAAQIRFERGDREIKTAVTNISHDLRTPLTAICGYLDLLEQAEKSEEVNRYIAIIGNRVENMKKLTEELFRYSVVASTEELKPEPLDIKRALEDSLLSFYGIFEQKGIRPEISLPENPVIKNLDPEAVNRIFSNIINNAAKYSGGDFSATLDETGGVTFINTAENLDTVAVGRFFERFYTVEASRNSTGLGLSIAKHLVEMMGGSITADYRENKLFISVQF